MTTPPHLQGFAERGPAFGTLVAAGSGTAMASVCIVGLLQVQHLAGGLWAALAVLLAGLLCWWLAHIFVRLMMVVPSGAGLFAYAARGLGRRAALILVLPYIGMSMLLVGFEALVVGALAEQLISVPIPLAALVFLLLSWAICRAGIRIGYRAQLVATWALCGGLLALSLLSLGQLAWRGGLADQLLTAPPALLPFVAAIGQSLFFFMGFELLTSHAELAPKERVARSLLASVGVLIVFYVGVSLGLATLPPDAPGMGDFAVPQLLIARQIGHGAVSAAIAVICILASFASFNGGLLGMSRLIFVLATQGILPRRFAVLGPGKLTAGPALTLLLAMAIAAMLLVRGLRLYDASILAAAVSAALVYATATWTREVGPFRGARRSRLARVGAILLAATLLVLAGGVIVDAGAARPLLLGFLAAAYGIAWLASRRRPARPGRGDVGFATAQIAMPLMMPPPADGGFSAAEH
jgi:amino acid transporter